jgi:hypothetical protein
MDVVKGIVMVESEQNASRVDMTRRVEANRIVLITNRPPSVHCIVSLYYTKTYQSREWRRGAQGDLPKPRYASITLTVEP